METVVDKAKIAFDLYIRKVERQAVVAMQITAIMADQVHFDKARLVSVPVRPGADGNLALEQHAGLGTMTRLGTRWPIPCTEPIYTRRANVLQTSITRTADLEHATLGTTIFGGGEFSVGVEGDF